MLNIYVGYDAREAIAYHVFCNSIIRHSSKPVSFTPLALNNLAYTETHNDGSNAFIYSRFLVPHLQNYQGWALFADGDMLCQDDINKLFELRNDDFAAMVVKHNYKTKFPKKYLGNKNENYPRKNWSSVILFNCSHPKNKVLTPEYIENATGAQLHRFTWLDDSDIGELPKTWNWLAMEYPDNYTAKLLHYTIATPCFTDYADCNHSDEWYEELDLTNAPINV